MAVSRYYRTDSVRTTLSSSVNNTTDATITIPSSPTPNFPTSYPFTIIVDRDLTTEEVMQVESISSSGGATITYNVTRGSAVESTITKQNHNAGAYVEHGVSARDFRESREHENALSGVHGRTGELVGTTDAQTLTYKTFSTGTVIPQTYVTNLTSDLALKAPLASPTFTGTPAAPTAAAATNTTQVATTAYVQGEITSKAPIASPTFTGTPAAPTATAGTSTTQLATTAFVTTADNLKAPLANPTFTGNIYFAQPTPTSKSAAGTLTIAELLTGIIDTGAGSAFSLTLPTGTLVDAGVVAGLAVDNAFEWSLINRGGGTVTVLAGTNHTISGSAAVGISSSGLFRTRKTATNTYVTYRVA